jgi:hypothetical protein
MVYFLSGAPSLQPSPSFEAYCSDRCRIRTAQLMMIWRAPVGRSSVMTGFQDEAVLQRYWSRRECFGAGKNVNVF